jgi:flagella basal body P-ring formation protein FlgA
MVTYLRRLLPVALIFATAAEAQPFQNLDALDAQVAGALGADIGEPGGAVHPIDRRLKLAPCPEETQVTAAGARVAAVRCRALGWRISVPLVSVPTAAKEEPIVRKGDQVELAIAGRSFTVSAVAVADEDGAAGDRIRVRMAKKATPLIGTVTEEGGVILHRFK